MSWRRIDLNQPIFWKIAEYFLVIYTSLYLFLIFFGWVFPQRFEFFGFDEVYDFDIIFGIILLYCNDCISVVLCCDFLIFLWLERKKSIWNYLIHVIVISNTIIYRYIIFSYLNKNNSCKHLHAQINSYSNMYVKI